MVERPGSKTRHHRPASAPAKRTLPALLSGPDFKNRRRRPFRPAPGAPRRAVVPFFGHERIPAGLAPGRGDVQFAPLCRQAAIDVCQVRHHVLFGNTGRPGKVPGGMRTVFKAVHKLLSNGGHAFPPRIMAPSPETSSRAGIADGPDLFFQQTTGNTNRRASVRSVFDIARLYQPVHHTPFGDVQPEKIGLIE